MGLTGPLLACSCSARGLGAGAHITQCVVFNRDRCFPQGKPHTSHVQPFTAWALYCVYAPIMTFLTNGAMPFFFGGAFC